MGIHVTYVTRDEERDLRRLAGSADQVTATRASIVIMSADGIHTSDIASALGVCKRTVRNAVTAFNRRGISSVTRKASPGRPRLLNSEQSAAIAELAQSPPAECGYGSKHWTVPLLLEEAQARAIVADISCDTLSRELRRAGIDLRTLRSQGRADNGGPAPGSPGRRGAPDGNTNAVRTGAYTNALLSEEDRPEYDLVAAGLQGGCSQAVKP